MRMKYVVMLYGLLWVWLTTVHLCSFWEPELVPLLLGDHVAVNMLYIEVMAHVDNGE